MSITASFIIAVIAAARLILKKLRAPKWVSYLLWAVAGIRMAVPVKLQSVFSLIPRRISEVRVPEVLTVPFSPVAIPGAAEAAVSAAAAGAAQATVPTVAASAVNRQDIIALIWLTGVAVMVLYAIVSYIALMRRRGSVSTPFVYGFLRPKIHLPDGMNEDELHYVTLHEQTHIERRDHIVKLFAFAVLCVHWFNPFAWLAFTLLCADMEMSCDERVLKRLGPSVKADYSMAILSLATRRRILNASPLAFGEGGMKTRVKNVLNFRKPSRVIILAAVVIAAALTAGLLMNGTWKNPKVAPDGMRALYVITPDRNIPDEDLGFSLPIYPAVDADVYRQMILHAVYTDNRIELIYGTDAKWHSSNEKVFTVDENGRITSTGIGEATLSVEYNGFKEKVAISVYNVETYDRIELVAPGFFEAADEDKAKYILPEVVEITPIGSYRRADGGMEGLGGTRLNFAVACFKGDEFIEQGDASGLSMVGMEGVFEDEWWMQDSSYYMSYQVLGPGTVNFSVTGTNYSSSLSFTRHLTVIVHDFINYYEPPIGETFDLPVLPDDKIREIDHIAFVKGSGNSENDGIGALIPKNGGKIGEVPASYKDAWENITGVPDIVTSAPAEISRPWVDSLILNIVAVTKDGEMYAIDEKVAFTLTSVKTIDAGMYDMSFESRMWIENGVWSTEAERYYAAQPVAMAVPKCDLLINYGYNTLFTVTAKYKGFTATLAQGSTPISETPWIDDGLY
jgi:beta-lactamase regulating signal transducer with metallopeptidase domain